MQLRLKKFSGSKKVKYKRKIYRRSKGNTSNKLIGFLKANRWLGWLGILGGMGILILYSLFNFWLVKSISCSANSKECDAKIVNWLNQYVDKSMINARVNLEKETLDKFPEITYLLLKWDGWNSLNIDILVEKPVAVVTSPGLLERNKYFLVDSRGVIIDEDIKEDLPLVVVDQLEVAVGGRLNERQLLALDITRKLDYLGYNFSVRQVDGQTLRVDLNSGESILFPLDGNRQVNQMVSALQVILSQDTIESDYLEVDLRFTQPLIRDLRVEVVRPTESPVATVSGEIEE